MKSRALITGASSGIGLELAKIHASLGNDLVIVSRNIDDLNKVKNLLESEFQVEVECIKKDLSVPGASIKLFDEINNKGIEIDCLINNAGFGGIGEFSKRTLEEDMLMIQLNIVSLTELSKLYLPLFLEKNRGKILNVSSIASLMPGPNQAVYYATKAYVTSLSNAINEEVKKTNVTVTALLPGATKSNFSSRSGMDKTKLFAKAASAEKVAKKGYTAMLKGKTEIIAGVSFSMRIMLFSMRFLPKKLVNKVVHSLQKV